MKTRKKEVSVQVSDVSMQMTDVYDDELYDSESKSAEILKTTNEVDSDEKSHEQSHDLTPSSRYEVESIIRFHDVHGQTLFRVVDMRPLKISISNGATSKDNDADIIGLVDVVPTRRVTKGGRTFPMPLLLNGDIK